jgi:putative transposase
VGVKHLAALSTGELVANPRVKASNARALVKASRAYARTVKGSKRREHARPRTVTLAALKREDPPSGGPPQRSDALTSPVP